MEFRGECHSGREPAVMDLYKRRGAPVGALPPQALASWTGFARADASRLAGNGCGCAAAGG